MKVPFSKLWRALSARISIKLKIPITMSTQELRTAFATECKKRTAAYFEQCWPPEVQASDKARTAAKNILEGNFGCATKGVTALVSTILGENLEPLVYPPKKPALSPGIMFVFLSGRIAHGKWIPGLVINKDGNHLNSFEEMASGSAGEEQLAKARQPSEQDIDDFFAQMSLNKLRLVLRSEFGAGALLQ